MGFMDLFKKGANAGKESVPEINDLPPIPKPAESSSDSKDVVIDSKVDTSTVDVPSSPNNSSSDTNSSVDVAPENSSSLNSSDSSLTKTASASESEVSSDKSVASDNQVSSSVPEDSKKTASDDSVIENPVDLVNDSVNEDSSLPVFEEVSDSSSVSEIDVSSLSISDLFVKKETYVSTLDLVSTTTKDLKKLTSKLALTLDEKIFSHLDAASSLHSSLNEGLLFIEEVITK